MNTWLVAQAPQPGSWKQDPVLGRWGGGWHYLGGCLSHKQQPKYKVTSEQQGEELTFSKDLQFGLSLMASSCPLNSQRPCQYSEGTVSPGNPGQHMTHR